ncbi:MAG: NmrA family NAD(P)-binding protein [Candidatus Dormibacteraeota bacterium]|nr:NmrA family NAD(P)-binding protein [Candidatus Dormibacteraeota bacterium]
MNVTCCTSSESRSFSRETAPDERRPSAGHDACVYARRTQSGAGTGRWVVTGDHAPFSRSSILRAVPRRIVLFGASGKAGRLVARELVAARARPVLAGRSHQKLAALGVQLGHGLDIAVADAGNPESVGNILRRGDVLVSTVGPFARLGTTAIEGAIAAGATYVDCAAEAGFLRRVFSDLDSRARAAGVALLPGIGFRYAAGSLAAELALEGLGDAVTRVHVGYAIHGVARGRDAGGLEPLTLFRRHPALTDIAVAVRAPRRSRQRAAVIATAYATDGSTLHRVRAHGPDAYTLTARFLAWTAMRLASHDGAQAGALGPVDAFGLGALRLACEAAGLSVDHF